MRSPTQHNFAQVEAPHMQRSVFDRRGSWKGTFDSGDLIPVYCAEILPGDTMVMDASFFARIQTLVFPIMDNAYLDIQAYYCPNRLVWNNWTKFLGEQDEPGEDVTTYLVPSIAIANDPVTQFAEGSLYDYFGLPTKVDLAWTTPDLNTETVHISALPFRMYNLIWNEWYRDQNLQAKVPVNKDVDNSDPATDYVILKRGKRHDYITAALPWPQKGEAVALPLAGQAPVVGDGNALGLFLGGSPYFLQTHDGTGSNGMLAVQATGGLAGSAPGGGFPLGDSRAGLATDPDSSHAYADLSLTTAGVTINQWRQAIAFQSLRERDARGGTRYKEIIMAHFGQDVGDSRLQRPEYLGGSSQNISVQQVPQTSGTPDTPGALSDTPQANLAAYGLVGTHLKFHKSFPEHGYVIILASVRGDLTYQQQIARHWTRQAKEEFYWPDLAHIGEQAVLNMEVYYDPSYTGADKEPSAAFGYQERYSEYKYGEKQVVGKFRSNATGTLHAWHLAQNWSEVPALSADFIEESTELDRVIAVPSEPQIMMDSLFKVRHVRPMPAYNTPYNIARF